MPKKIDQLEKAAKEAIDAVADSDCKKEEREDALSALDDYLDSRYSDVTNEEEDDEEDDEETEESEGDADE